MNFLAHVWNANIAWLCDPVCWISMILAGIGAFITRPYDMFILKAKAWLPYLFVLLVAEVWSCYQVFVVHW